MTVNRAFLLAVVANVDGGFIVYYTLKALGARDAERS